MKQHRCCGLVLTSLLVVLSASACSASSFVEWMAAQKGEAVASRVQADEHADVDKDGYHAAARTYVEQCLNQVNLKNCRAAGGSADGDYGYFEAGATCCDARSHSGNSMGNSNIEVGTCKFRQYWFNEPVPEAPGVAKYGEFSVQCYLNAASDSCGHPFCDQMVLSASGGIYVARDLVLASRPISPYFDDSCVFGGKQSARREKMFGSQSGKGQKGGAGGAQTDDSTAKIAAAEVAGKHKHPPNLHSGIGLIYFGPMTVSSRAHDVSIKDGWFEFVSDYLDLGAISEADAAGKHVINPHTFALELFKPEHASY